MKKLLTVVAILTATLFATINANNTSGNKTVKEYDDGQHLQNNIYLYYGKTITYDNDGRVIYESDWDCYKFVNHNRQGFYEVCYKCKNERDSYCTGTISPGNTSGTIGMSKGHFVSEYEVIRK